jgi:hypothetical protein
MRTFGAVVISRNDNYGGDLAKKFVYTLSSLIKNLDEVYYVDWNSPNDQTLFEEVRNQIPKTGRLKVVTVDQALASKLTNNDPDVQYCCEVLARNIGIRRLTTDYIISTNSDVMTTSRMNIESDIKDQDTFYTVARTEVHFSDVTGYEPASYELSNFMESNKGRWPQPGDGSPLGPADRWSLVNCPGDFQVAHRDVWHSIKGFDEDLIYRSSTDSNVQRKADMYGYKLKLVRNIMACHFRHYPDTGATGGTSNKWNDMNKAIFEYEGTKNPDTWGFSDLDLNIEVI